MKKLFCLILFFSTYIETTHAGGDESMVSSGIFLDFGLSFPTSGYSNVSSFLGITPTISIGNKFIFTQPVEDKIGIGMNVTWLTLGVGVKDGYKSIYFEPLRFGPTGCYAFNDQMAVDVFVDLMPTFILNGTFNDGDDAFIDAGFQVVPGGRFRYKLFSVGVELGIGRVTGIDIDGNYTHGTLSILAPRITAGFKF